MGTRQPHMEIVLTRDIFSDTFCMSHISLECEELDMTGHFGYSVEDTDRGLSQDDELDHIFDTKVHGETAIPVGLYEVLLQQSMKYGPDWPTVIGVPGWLYIRFHSGNHANHTEGCIMTGKYRDPDGEMEWGGRPVKGCIYNSRNWTIWLVNKIRLARSMGMRVYFRVQREEDRWEEWQSQS